MSPTDELIPILKKLRLSGVLQTLELRTRQAVEDDLTHPEFLYRLLCDEMERRDSEQLRQRTRRAGFEQAKSLEDFDFHFNPQVPKTKIIDLATGLFVERHECILLIGPTGTGKSHIAQALGLRACLLGASVLYTNAQQLLSELRAARADHSYDKKLLRFTTPSLLIIDDLGLKPLRGDEPIDLFEIIRQRYEKGAMIISSNRALEEWPPLFGDSLLASAAMDRLLHHAHILTMDGDSYRTSQRRRNARSTPPARPGAPT